jgi:hypothetical protein
MLRQDKAVILVLRVLYTFSTLIINNSAPPT